MPPYHVRICVRVQNRPKIGEIRAKKCELQVAQLKQGSPFHGRKTGSSIQRRQFDEALEDRSRVRKIFGGQVLLVYVLVIRRVLAHPSSREVDTCDIAWGSLMTYDRRKLFTQVDTWLYEDTSKEISHISRLQLPTGAIPFHATTQIVGSLPT